MLKKLFLIFHFIAFLQFYAQTFEWVKSEGSNRADDCMGIFKIKNGYLTINRFGDTSKNTEETFIPSNRSLGSYFWAFRNDSGTIRKVIKIDQDSVIKRYVKKLENGRYFLSIDYATFDSFIINGKKINIKKQFPFYEIDTFGTLKIFSSIQILNNRELRTSVQIESINDKIIAIISLNNNVIVKINADTIKAKSNEEYLIILFDKYGNILKYNKPQINLRPWAIKANGDGTCRVISNLMNTFDSFKFQNVKYNYSRYSNCYTHLVDSNLNITSFESLYSGNNNNRTIAVIDKGSYFYNADYFVDSPSMKIKFFTDSLILKKGRNSLVVFIQNNKLKFYKHFTVHGVNRTNCIQGVLLNYFKGFCLVGAQIVNPSLINPDSLIINNPENDGNIFAMKLDTFGNILWSTFANSIGSSDGCQGINYDSSGSVIVGNFNKNLSINNFIYPSVGSSDALLFKITDNSIYRGDIFPGPYCAGDTILIPFKANGKYNDTNTFFAELSDENGNFFGKQRLLGLKSSIKSDTIVGIIPLFDVLSSPNYRIRVRSNSPFVQSFMRYDNFKIKIYSKDKALPGPDTTVCAGRPVSIWAKGGSVWHWSPGNAVAESTARTTTFLGKKTTRLRITISDTGGCGLPDTAFQTITVLPKITALGSSVKSCVGQSVNLIASSVGGKASQMQYQWILPNGSTENGASISFVANGEKTLHFVASDNCSAPDTSFVSIEYYPAPLLQNLDTTVCANNIFEITPKAVFESGMQFPTYSWFTKNNNFISNGILKSSISTDTQFILIASDNCSKKSDTMSVNISVFTKPTFSYTIDSACAVVKHRLVFLPNHGVKPYTYFINSTKSDSISFIPAIKNQSLFLHITDACNNQSKTDTLEIFKQPNILLTALPDKGCIPFQSLLKIRSNISGLSYRWQQDGQSVATNLDSLWLQIMTEKIVKIKVFTQNNVCIDSTQTQLQSFPLPKADFVLSKTEMNIEEKQIRVNNTSTLANKYVFYWDGKKRIFQNPDTFYINIADTGKFRVMLVAKNQYGCTDTAFREFVVYPLPKVYWPTGFTANGDQLNESFYPKGLGIKSYRLQIFNRWGQQVFKGQANQAWAPAENLLPGMYVYRCIINGYGEIPVEFKGVVMMVR